MKKERRNIEEIDRFIGETFGVSPAKNSSEQTVSEFRAKGMKNIQEKKQQETEHTIEHATPSEPAQHTEHATVQRRISAKMRKETLEAYKQAFLVPTKLSERKAVYLSRETQERADFAGWVTGVAIFQVSWRTSCASIWRNTVRTQRNGGSCKLQENGQGPSGKRMSLSLKILDRFRVVLTIDFY